MKLSLTHTLVDALESGEPRGGRVPHVLDLLVDEVRRPPSGPHHLLLEDLVELVLEQHLGGLPERHPAVRAVELDVGAPRQQDEEEAARRQHQQRRQQQLQRGRLEALDRLGDLPYININVHKLSTALKYPHSTEVAV